MDGPLDIVSHIIQGPVAPVQSVQLGDIGWGDPESLAHQDPDGGVPGQDGGPPLLVPGEGVVPVVHDAVEVVGDSHGSGLVGNSYSEVFFTAWNKYSLLYL